MRIGVLVFFGLAAALFSGARGLPAPAEARADSALATQHYRALQEYEAVYLALVAGRPLAVPSRRYDRSIETFRRGDFRFDEDLKRNRIAFNQVRGFLTDVRFKDLPEFVDLRAAFGDLGIALLDVTHREIEVVEDRVDRFESLNPSKSVKAQRAAIDLARRKIQDITVDTDFERTVVKLRSALLLLKSVRTFPHVANPPRKKCPAPLAKGGSVEGAWSLFDFDDQTTYPGYFRANWGGAQAFSDGTMLEIRFGYCDGVDRHIVDVRFTCPAAPGTHMVTGGFTQGPNSLCCSILGTSTVTIETIDLSLGFVSGTFDVRASNGTGGGPGRFFLAVTAP